MHWRNNFKIQWKIYPSQNIKTNYKRTTNNLKKTLAPADGYVTLEQKRSILCPTCADYFDI
jgi:hypothetical protein